MPRDTTVAVAGEFPVNEFNLTAKLFIFVVAILLMLFVRLVIEAAGSQPAYLAGFRN